jgi:hypothetical protein
MAVYLCPGCSRNISVSWLPGGNPIAQANGWLDYRECNYCPKCQSLVCPACAPESKLVCPKCGGQLQDPDPKMGLW